MYKPNFLPIDGGGINTSLVTNYIRILATPPDKNYLCLFFVNGKEINLYGKDAIDFFRFLVPLDAHVEAFLRNFFNA